MMKNDLAEFLQNQTHLDEAWPIWANGRVHLRQHTYLSQELPPDAYISSSRAILFRGDEVMVIQDHKNEPYIVPGGRREPGESVLQTLHREVLEETGWTISAQAMLGFVHFHHLTPKPNGHPYPYPDFIQVIYTAVADSYHPEAIEEDAYVTSSNFLPLEDALDLAIDSYQAVLLDEAIGQYEVLR